MPPQNLVADFAAERLQPALQPGTAFRRRQRVVLGLALPNEIDKRQRLAEHPFDRRRAAGAGEIVRVLAFRQKREAQRAGRCRSAAETRSMAAKAALRPARSPSKQRIGSSAIFQIALIASVSAVPSGATVCGKPAARHGDDIDIAFDGDDGALVVGRLPA